MVVDRHTRLLAMYWVYRNTRMADCFVAIGELELRWRKTGLRRADLLRALNEMVERGYLAAIHDGALESYRLTQAGTAEFRFSRIALTYAISHWITLLRALVRRLWRAGSSGHDARADRRLSAL